MSTIAAATKNGHPILVNGTGFEGGAKVRTESFDYDEADREFAEEQREIGRREVMADLYQLMRRGFDLIIRDPNMRLAADAYTFAAGTTDVSEVDLAEKYGVTKAAVSKRVKQWQELLHLPPAAAMRSNKACETFKRETTKSWKRRSKPARLNPQTPHQKPTQTLLQRLQLAPA